MVLKFNIMANTFTQLNMHVVFSVKGRKNILSEKIRVELFKYITGILSNIGQYPLAVNGYNDHIHIFFEIQAKDSLSNIVSIIKANSSKWINDNKLVAGKFEWQEGYGGFSYSRSQRNNVIQYILKQEEHHKMKTFREEYMSFLKEFEIPFDEKYIFEFYD